MIITQEYSRIAAVFTMDAGQALRVLDIEGTGNFEEDKKMMRRLLHQYHPDKATDEDAEEKMVAINVLMETYIRNKRRLPGKERQRQQPSNAWRTPRTEEQESSTPSSESVLLNSISLGFDFINEALRLSEYWVSQDKDCNSVTEDLNNGVYRGLEGVVKILATRVNLYTYPRFSKTINKFYACYARLREVNKHCRDFRHGDSNQVGGFALHLHIFCEDALKDEAEFNRYYDNYLATTGRAN